MRRKEPLVTILTSAYNAENTLRNTIESVCNQTYRNIEYIIINHGSNDHTHRVIEEAKKQDARIQSIELEENHGFIGYALNQGLEKAKGEYVTFLDADDRFEQEYIEKMVERIEYIGSDIAICGYHYVDERNQIFRTVSLTRDLDIRNKIDYIELWKEIENSSFGYLYVWWNKLYRKSFLENSQIKLPENTYVHGDAMFNAMIFQKKPKIYCLSECLVNWSCIIGSTSHGTYKKGYYKEAIESTNMYSNLIETMVFDNTLRKSLYKKLVLSICHLRRIEHYKETQDNQIQELESWIQDPIYQQLIQKADMEQFVVQFWQQFIHRE